MKNEKGHFFILQVKVTPRSHKSEVVGYEGQMLKIRLRALPEKGDANAELVRILAEFFDLPRSHIEIKRGHTSRIKQLQIYGIEGQGALKKLKEMGASTKD